jgi:hypothetical protein
MSYTVSDNIRKLFNLDKQIIFAAAQSLTEVAKEAQTAVIADIQKTFTTRGKWYLPSNKYGIKVKPAKKTDLSAEVKTAADWLALHETGGTKTAQSGKDLIIPFVGTGQPRANIASKIRKALKPGALGSQAFIINTKSGPVLFYRRGKRQKLTALYDLEPSVKVKKESTVIAPTVETVQRSFDRIFEKNLANAVRNREGGLMKRDSLRGI